MIARILLAASLVLLACAAAPALSGSVQIDLTEEPAPCADDEAAAPLASVHAASRACAARSSPSEEVVLPGLALARIFRPPRHPRSEPRRRRAPVRGRPSFD